MSNRETSEHPPIVLSNSNKATIISLPHALPLGCQLRNGRHTWAQFDYDNGAICRCGSYFMRREPNGRELLCRTKAGVAAQGQRR